MSKTEVVLTVDVQRSLENFPFLHSKNVTLLEREDKGNLYSLCDGVSGGGKWCCFWDRHVIDGAMFKCPVRKIYKGGQKTYTSNINGNTYTMSDHLNTQMSYYETDGHFCSPQCCMSFLDDEAPRNPLYANSAQLIIAALGEEPNRAPNWRLLAGYGGTMTISEFRQSCANKNYVLEEMISGSFPFIYKFKEVWHL